MLKPVDEFINEAKANCDCLDAKSAKSFYDKTQNTTVLDVREPPEVENTKLAVSTNIPRGVLEMKIARACPDPEQPILVHCAGGGRASLSAARLQEMGYNNVHVIAARFDEIKEVFG